MLLSISTEDAGNFKNDEGEGNSMIYLLKAIGHAHQDC